MNSIRVLLAVPLLVGLSDSRVFADAIPTIVHTVDDGTSESTTGLGLAGGSIVFANHFAADLGGEEIRSISVSYGHRGVFAYAHVGTPVLVLLFRDADGSALPLHPVLLASAPSTVMKPYTDIFNDVPIPPTNVSGDFFVGVQVSRLPASGVYPISFDKTKPRHQSFAAFFTHPVGEAQVSTLGYDPTLISSQVPLDTNTFVRVVDGNFMIRATGVPVPEPAAGASLLIATGLLAFRPFRRRARAG